jgi:hypothetical protein
MIVDPLRQSGTLNRRLPVAEPAYHQAQVALAHYLLQALARAIWAMHGHMDADGVFEWTSSNGYFDFSIQVQTRTHRIVLRASSRYVQVDAPGKKGEWGKMATCTLDDGTWRIRLRRTRYARSPLKHFLTEVSFGRLEFYLRANQELRTRMMRFKVKFLQVRDLNQKLQQHAAGDLRQLSRSMRARE